MEIIIDAPTKEQSEEMAKALAELCGMDVDKFKLNSDEQTSFVPEDDK